MFWKKGKCNKGDKCLFRHDGPPGKPSGPSRQPSNETPSAATPAKDGKPRLPSPAPKRRPSRGRSRSKEKTRTAACCLSYAMAAPTKHQVRINPKPHVWHIDVEGKGSPHLTKQRRYSTVYIDSSHCPKPDRRDTTQAIEAAKELEAIVVASTNDVKVPCNFEGSDFGLTCQHCEKLYQLSCVAHNAGLEFLADTGSEEDLISRSDHELYYSEIPIESASKHVSLMTANGSIQGDRSVTLSMPMIGQTVDPTMHGEPSSASSGPTVPHDPTRMPDGEPVPPGVTGDGVRLVRNRRDLEGPPTHLPSFGQGCRQISVGKTSQDSKNFKDKPKKTEKRERMLPQLRLSLLISSLSIESDSKAFTGTNLGMLLPNSLP